MKLFHDTWARSHVRAAGAAFSLCVLFAAETAFAATYQVGPNKPYTSLNQLDSALAPGDIVEVDGNHTYQGGIVMQPDSSGTASNPVIIRGIPIDGKRPVIQGGNQSIVLYQDHVIFENFEITGGAASCVINKGHDITLRNLLVRDCSGHGILGTDMYAGSQTLELVEVRNCGNGQYEHQVYLATDNTMYPDAKVRIQHSYIHDAAGGHNIKSRASRNEIYNNWIEAPAYHVLDLIGADGQAPGLVREDSEVVGNVLIQTGSYAIARIGGDGTGSTSGRYRFAYNTIVMSSSQGDAIRLQDELESLAVDNNVFLTPNGGSPILVKDNGAVWTSGAARRTGANNFVQNGISPASFFTSTVTGSTAAFENVGGGNYMPVANSPVLDAGTTALGPSGYVFPNALVVPTAMPTHGIPSNLLAPARGSDGAPDIGAFELGSGSGGGDGGGDPGSGGSGEGGSGSGGANEGGASEGGSGQGGSGGGQGEGGSGEGGTLQGGSNGGGSNGGSNGGGSNGTGATNPGGSSGDGGSDEDTGSQCSYAPARRTHTGAWLLLGAAALIWRRWRAFR